MRLIKVGLICLAIALVMAIIMASSGCGNTAVNDLRGVKGEEITD